MTRRSGKRRPKRLAAAVVAGGLMLVPVVLATPSGRYTIPISVPLADAIMPNPGDLLAAVRRAQAKPEDYGASGKLPEADTLSPEIIAALAGPAAGNSGIFNTGAGPLASVTPGPLGIPGVMLDAYVRAEKSLAASHPNCGVHWSVLAAIGRIESNHARGGAVDGQGTTVRPILGPQLSGGPGVAAIPDSDGGALDGDRVWDRAVGPMQFIPTTWARYAADGNNDGTASPHNIHDATVAAGRYLCAGGGDLRNPVALAQAIFSYNHSDPYVANVLSWAAAYASGVTPLPSSPTPVGPIGEQPPQAAPPPVDVGPPDTTVPPSSTTTSTASSTTTTTTTTSETCPTVPPTSTSTTTSETTITPPPPGCETTTPPPSSSATSEPPAQTSVPQSSESSTMQSSSEAQSSADQPVSTTEAAPASTTESGTASSGDAAATTTSLPPA